MQYSRFACVDQDAVVGVTRVDWHDDEDTLINWIWLIFVTAEIYVIFLECCDDSDRIHCKFELYTVSQFELG